MEIFGISGLTFSYQGQTEPALKDLNFKVEQGEFIALIGPSGSGKSTLLRQLKTVLTPHGVREGQILFEGKPLAEIDIRRQASDIAFVMQSAENQAVTDKVWHELAFGLESLGFNSAIIRARVAETACFFGMESWIHKDISALSGGQKQLVNLASVMAMQPSVLILDEPCGQLDPIAASEFIAAVSKINRELGVTVIITEHRLEEVLCLADRVMVMEEGGLIFDGRLGEAGAFLKKSARPMFLSMPTPMRVWGACESGLPCPITVRDGRNWLSSFAEGRELNPLPPQSPPVLPSAPAAIELSGVWFRYEKDGDDILKGLSLKAYPGELLCVVGGNGAGKSTVLSLIAGLNRPFRGGVKVGSKRVSTLPQDPQTLFSKKTVLEDLCEMTEGLSLSKEEATRLVLQTSRLCRLEGLLARHPYDLSGGEKQRAALAKILLGEPEILLLDEPTKGFDPEFKETFAAILKGLAKRGVCVVMVSHDLEFCAKHADRCALLFDGAIITENAPRAFFKGNSFYTTAANRMARHLLPEVVTAEEVIACCGGVLPPEHDEIFPIDPPLENGGLPVISNEKEGQKLPLWRWITALFSGAAALGSFVFALTKIDLTAIVQTGISGETASAHTGVYIILLLSLFVLALSVNRRAEAFAANKAQKEPARRLPSRTLAALFVIVFAIPLTVLAGIYLFDDRKYYFISLLVILEAMLPFAVSFESRRPQARELVFLASLCALGVAGRAAFIALPGFKPVLALVIVSGVAFGGEAGFLVGAMVMFVSNMLFGQGPWTPWQMFAMGTAGFLSGIFYSKSFLQRSRLSLGLFGVFAAIVIYGGIINAASVVMYQPNPTLPMLFAAYAVGFPVDLVHAAATMTFLWYFSNPLLEKLDRIKAKYGLLEDR